MKKKKWTGNQIYTYLSSLSRHLTRIGKIPDFIRSSIGGFLSLDKSFLGKKNIRIYYNFQTTNSNNNVLLLDYQIQHPTCDVISLDKLVFTLQPGQHSTGPLGYHLWHSATPNVNFNNNKKTLKNINLKIFQNENIK